FMSDWPESKLLDYAVNHLEWMEENCNTDEERCVLRRIAVEVARRFGEPGSVFFDDPKMLTVIRIIGKVSRRMGLKGVLKKAYERGQFRKLAEFYILWAKVYAEEGDEKYFNEVWALALIAPAQPLAYIDEAFSAMRREYFSTTINRSVVSVSENAEGRQQNIVGKDSSELNAFTSLSSHNTQQSSSASGVSIEKPREEQGTLYAASGKTSSFQEKRNFVRHSPRRNGNRNGKKNKVAIIDESLSMEERAAMLIGCAISPYALKNWESRIREEKTMDPVNSSKSSDMTSSHSCHTVSEITAVSLSSEKLANRQEAAAPNDCKNAHISTNYKTSRGRVINGDQTVLRDVVENSIRADEHKVSENEQMISGTIPQFCFDEENVNPVRCEAYSDRKSPTDELFVDERISGTEMKKEKISIASATPHELKPPSSFFSLSGYSVFRQASPMKSFPEMPDSFRKKQPNYSVCTSENTQTTTSVSTGSGCCMNISPTSDFGGFRPVSASCADALFPVPKDEFAGMTGFERRMSLSKDINYISFPFAFHSSTRCCVIWVQVYPISTWPSVLCF
uniref:BUB1 N-terminal domain-containing protein n=1 Tax=Parascaris univalens TaxID=6257 RepID=A0A915BV41_PARUN